MTRYLIVAPEFPPDTVGGGGLVFARLTQSYMKHGDLFVIVGDWRSPPTGTGIQFLQPRGILFRVPLLRNRLDVPGFRTTLPPTHAGRALLRHLITAWRPSVAHLHGYGYLIVDCAAGFLRDAGVPYVLTSHGLPVSQGEGRLRIVKTAAYRLYQATLANRTAFGATAVTAVSWSAMPPHVQGTVVANGVAPLPVIEPPERSEQEAAGWRIGACGRLAPSKGFDVLLRALAYLPDVPVECVVAGADGGHLAQLVRLAQKLGPNATVQFPGPVDRDGIARLMAWSDVVVMPSRHEPFGLVAFEALAAGKRVVASRTGGLADWLQDPALPVVLVEPGDENALAEGIVTAVRRGAPSGTEANAVQALLNVLDWDLVSEQYLGLLHDVEGHRGDSRRPGGPGPSKQFNTAGVSAR